MVHWCNLTTVWFGILQADLLAKDVKGRTPCNVARENSHTEIVDLLIRHEVKKEAMEEKQQEHARRPAQHQSVVVAKMKEAAELRGRLNDIVLSLECGCCFEKLCSGSVSFDCGHTYCNRPTCESRLVDTCPHCRLPVTTRVAVTDENAKESLEEDKTF